VPDERDDRPPMLASDEEVTRDLPAQPRPAEVDAETERSTVVAIMSGADRSGRWRLGERCRAIAVMGGCELDLRGAELTAQDRSR
jgi:hypothetical protein